MVIIRVVLFSLRIKLLTHCSFFPLPKSTSIDLKQVWALERVEKLLEKDGKPYRVSQCFPLLSLLRLFRTGFHQPFTSFIFTKTWSSALRSCHKLPYWASDWYSSCPEINERMGFKIYKAPALEVTSPRGVVMFRKSGGNGAT